MKIVQSLSSEFCSELTRRVDELIGRMQEGEKLAEIFAAIEELELLQEQADTLILIKRRWIRYKGNTLKGIIDESTLNLQSNQLNNDVLEFLKLLKEECKEQLKVIIKGSFGQSSSISGKKRMLNEHHAYTCNRNEQYSQFLSRLKNKQSLSKQSTRKVFFFNLFGEKKQAHKGLFRRFLYHLEGRYYFKYKIRDFKPTRRVKNFEHLSLPATFKLDINKIEFIRELAANLEVDLSDVESLETKKLDFFYQSKIAQDGFSSGDCLCFLLTIREKHLKQPFAKEMLCWLIKEFSNVALPKQAPYFFFFISVSFGAKRNSEKPNIEAFWNDIFQKIGEGQQLFISQLPELEMVPKNDVEEWFEEHQEAWEEEEIMEDTLEEYFAEESYYMKEVQRTLLKIIDELNDTYKDDIKST